MSDADVHGRTTSTRLTDRGRIAIALAALVLILGVVQVAAAVGVEGDRVGPTVLASAFPKMTVVDTIQGEATYYGPGLEGGMTASGAPFDAEVVAAAHPTLPFGTQVRVVGPDGRSVRVEINDRLPGAGSDRIDLTTAAFRRLAPLDAGRIPVTMEILGSPSPS